MQSPFLQAVFRDTPSNFAPVFNVPLPSLTIIDFWRLVVGRDTFSALAPTLGRYQKNCLCDPLPLFMAFSMIPKYVTFELLLRSAFVAGVDWGLTLGLNQLVLHTVRGIRWDLVGPSSPKFRVSAKGFKVRTNVFRVGGRNVILYVAIDVNYHPIRGCRVTKSWSYHISYLVWRETNTTAYVYAAYSRGRP